jgi:hypothetical protein
MKRSLTIGFILLSAACGGSNTPVAPTPVVPGPTVSTVTVTSMNATVFLGATEQMNATETLSNGITQTAVGTWGSDNTSVASVSSSGLVTGVGAGEATVYVDVASMPRATKRIRALPAYAGTWTGTYLVITCVQSGVFVDDNFCRDYAGSLPFTFNLTQTQDTVTGAFLLGQIPFVQTTASVFLNGDLFLASRNAGGSEASIDAVWTVNSARPQQLTGTVRHTWLADGNGGAATVTGTIESANRRALADQAVLRPLVTLDDLRRASVRD